MFCPKCGNQVVGNDSVCSKCGYDFSADIASANQTAKGEQAQVNESCKAAQTVVQEQNAPVEQTKANADTTVSELKKPEKNKTLALVFFGLAALVLILAFVAAGKVVEGGTDIAGIESVGGKTLEEAYYHYLGTVYAGYATFIRCMGIFFASVLAYFGLKV